MKKCHFGLLILIFSIITMATAQAASCFTQPEKATARYLWGASPEVRQFVRANATPIELAAADACLAVAMQRHNGGTLGEIETADNVFGQPDGAVLEILVVAKLHNMEPEVLLAALWQRHGYWALNSNIPPPPPSPPAPPTLIAKSAKPLALASTIPRRKP